MTVQKTGWDVRVQESERRIHDQIIPHDGAGGYRSYLPGTDPYIPVVFPLLARGGQ